MAVEWNDFSNDSTVGEYRVIGKIGHGTFSEVFRGVHKQTGSDVALKHVIDRAPARDTDGLGEMQRLSHEIAALKTLSHPNIVQLLEVIPQEGGHVLVMELCQTDLATVLQHTTQRLDEALVKGIMTQLLQGYVHQDLKPGNLLLTTNGTLKLADFGLAHPCAVERASVAKCDAAVATRWYRAPELLLSAQSCSPAADMWSVGCIMAELLGLCPIFAGETDLDQLSRITAVLGSIDLQTWPEAQLLPDYGKVHFDTSPGTPFSEILPDASPFALDLLQQLLQWNPGIRPKASTALQHPFFASEPTFSSLYLKEMSGFVNTSVRETVQLKH